MSVVVGVRTAMKHKVVTKSFSANDMKLVEQFVSQPDAFASMHSAGMSATQTGQNPFGDYAPQSSQIQGILKGMYDAFTTDLEKDNVNEANAQKSFEELMATKMQELKTLQATLEKQESDMAAKTKKLAEDEVLRDDTTADLAADEKFFEETKKCCRGQGG